MKKYLKRIVPFLLSLGIIASVAWYLLVYDRDFTRDMLLHQARYHDTQGHSKMASLFYDLAYQHTGQDDAVAIELANQYRADGNYTKAEQTLTQAIADGGTAELYIALCKTYVEQDKLQDAVAMLDYVADPAVKAQLDAQRPAAPTAEPAPGFYSQYISVGIAADGTLYYSTDGEYPSTGDAPYAEPIHLQAGETVIHAVNVAQNGLVSPMTVLGYTVGGVIEEVTFTDAAMDAAVREILGLDAEDTLMSNALWSITEFTVPTEATTLEDLALLPYLQKLTVKNMTLNSLSCLSPLTSLTELTLNNCRFPTADLAVLAALPKLTTLSMPHCGLSTVAELATAQNLTHLDLGNNTLRNLEPLSGMSTLVELDLQHNAVTSLAALSTLTSLNTLDISYNSVTDLSPLTGCVNLSWLNAGNNSLTALTGVNSLPGLTYLALDHNKIANVSLLGSCTELTELDISNNTLTDISALATLTNLEKLNFSYNEVEKLPAWPDGCALTTIDGSYNKLTSINGLKNMGELTYVYMDYNKLTSVDALAVCYHLVMVNVYGNDIKDVSKLTSRDIIVNYDPTN